MKHWMNFNYVMTEDDLKILEGKIPEDISKEELQRKILEFTLNTKQIPPKVKSLKGIRGQFRAEREKIKELQRKAQELGYSASELFIRGIREFKKRT
jgi:tRNA U55 pseudouridine synthase TruB